MKKILNLPNGFVFHVASRGVSVRVASVRVAAHLGAARAGEEIEVAALVGLLDVLGVKPGPAAGGGLGRRGPRGAAGRELVVGDVEAQRARGDVERDPVAAADQGERAA